MIQSGIEVKYREHLFLIEFVLTHLETADRKQVIDSLPFGIRSVRSVRSDRQGQVILARSKILGKKRIRLSAECWASPAMSSFLPSGKS